MSRRPLALAWAVLALPPAPARGQSLCGKDGMALLIDADPTAKPLTRIISSLSPSDACRRYLLNEMAVQLDASLRTGMCQGPACEEMRTAVDEAKLLADAKGDLCEPGQCREDGTCDPCVPRADALAIVSRADDALAKGVGPEVDEALRKIDAKLVPTCLLPEGCPGDGCRTALAKTWWDDSWTKQNDGQFVLKDGGLAHLAVSQTFTCEAGRQKGGTCVIYSGVNLMNHYCATPYYNPAAERTCGVPAGAGFRCPGAGEFLRAAYDAGAWKLARCVEEPETSSTDCTAIAEGPSDKDERGLMDKVREACPDGQPPTPKCVGLSAKLQALRFKAGGAPGAWAGGGYGVDMSRLEPVRATYRRFGFDVVLYPATDKGFDDALDAVRDGNPAQLLLKTGTWWAGYGEGTSDSHAVVLEGLWTAPDKTDWVLLRDSNNAGAVVGFKAADIRQRVKTEGVGLLGVCPPNAAGRCRGDQSSP